MWTPEEDRMLVEAHSKSSSQWDKISESLMRWDA